MKSGLKAHLSQHADQKTPSLALNKVREQHRHQAESKGSRCSSHRRRARSLRNIVRSRTTHVPRPDIRQLAVLGKHRGVRTHIADIGTESAEVGVVCDVSANDVSPRSFLYASRANTYGQLSKLCALIL